mmetsp:Transcript_2495/g.5190  ORF Transcript_2495/g.5190 Transcript_2495/m.5190 type:complete len:226 (-) Transcript_2495:64-741(-)
MKKGDFDVDKTRSGLVQLSPSRRFHVMIETRGRHFYYFCSIGRLYRPATSNPAHQSFGLFQAFQQPCGRLLDRERLAFLTGSVCSWLESAGKRRGAEPLPSHGCGFETCHGRVPNSPHRADWGQWRIHDPPLSCGPVVPSIPPFPPSLQSFVSTVSRNDLVWQGHSYCRRVYPTLLVVFCRSIASLRTIFFSIPASHAESSFSFGGGGCHYYLPPKMIHYSATTT